MTDHATYMDEVGAYLLGALTDAERSAFEGHLAGCPECRHELERLRPAAELLPRSVEQVEPPPSLKRSLMEVVEREASAAGTAEPAASRRRPLGERLRRLLLPVRPVMVAGVLAAGLLIGFAVAQLGGGDEGRTVVASVDHSKLPDASGRLTVHNDGEATLEVRGMPSPGRDRVYQAWVQRGQRVIPSSLFAARADGSASAAIPHSLDGAERVMVSREPRGGSKRPTGRALVSVELRS